MVILFIGCLRSAFWHSGIWAETWRKRGRNCSGIWGKKCQAERGKSKSLSRELTRSCKGGPYGWSETGKALSRGGVPMGHQDPHWLRCPLQALRGVWSCLTCGPSRNLHSWDVPAAVDWASCLLLSCFPSMALPPKVGGVIHLTLWWPRRGKIRKPLSG